jgi:hypothetical protein
MRGNAFAGAVVAGTMALTTLCLGPAAQASMPTLMLASQREQSPVDPLAGKAFAWTLTEAPIEGMTCQEHWTFNQDGTVTFQSDAEITTHSYSLYRDPATGVVLMTRRRMTSNGQADCTGASDPSTGQIRETILRFESDAGFLTCTDVTAESCFGKAVMVSSRVASK